MMSKKNRLKNSSSGHQCHQLYYHQQQRNPHHHQHHHYHKSIKMNFSILVFVLCFILMNSCISSALKYGTISSTNPKTSSSQTQSKSNFNPKVPTTAAQFMKRRSSPSQAGKNISPLEMLLFGPSDGLMSHHVGRGSKIYGTEAIASSSNVKGGTPLSPVASASTGYRQQTKGTGGGYGTKGGGGGGGIGFGSSSGGYGTKGPVGGFGSIGGSSYGGGGGISSFGGGASGYGGGAGGGGSSGYGGEAVSAAVKSHHSVEFVDVPFTPANYQPQTILVEAVRIPLNILFQSRSSNLNIQSDHTPSQGSVQESSSEDEPHHLIHRVTKPIIQEVFETITPYRKITQEIQPVQEEIQTIVSRAVDNKYVAVNNQFKGQSGGQQLHQLPPPPPPPPPMIPQPHKIGSPVQQQQILQQELSLQQNPITIYQPHQLQQMEMYGESRSNDFQSIRPNPISYSDLVGDAGAGSQTSAPSAPSNPSDHDVFLNVIKNEVNRLKESAQYKPQPTTTRNSYVSQPMPIYESQKIKSADSKEPLNSRYQPINQMQQSPYPFTTYMTKQPKSNEHRMKLEPYQVEPRGEASKLDPTLVTTLMPTTVSDVTPSSTMTQQTLMPTTTALTTTTTTTMRPETTETEMVPTSTSSSIQDTIDTMDSGIQSFMMYTGTGSMYVTQPSSLIVDDRRKTLKSIGYSVPLANNYGD